VLRLSGNSSFNYHSLEHSINRALFSIRNIKYADYDYIIKGLISKLKVAKINHFMKDSCFYFSFPKTSTVPFIYFNTSKDGVDFSTLVKASNCLIEPLLFKN